MKVKVCSPNVQYFPSHIETIYTYESVVAQPVSCTRLRGLGGAPDTVSTGKSLSEGRLGGASSPSTSPSVGTSLHTQCSFPSPGADVSQTTTFSTPTSSESDGFVAVPTRRRFRIRTDTRVKGTGLMIVGLGGNNGTTVLAGILANQHQIAWNTKSGVHQPNWYGSVCLSSTTKLGVHPLTGQLQYVPLSGLVPMLDPAWDVVVGGWDISGECMASAMRRAEVLDWDLQERLYGLMCQVDVRGDRDSKAGEGEDANGSQSAHPAACSVPLPGVYFPSFIAANQGDRATNVLGGSKLEQLIQVRQHIRRFKAAHNLEKVVVIWSATTERFVEEVEGVNDSPINLLESIKRGEEEVSPSIIYAVAAILERCSYINGSPQNTLLPAVCGLAEAYGVFVGGNDFKSGQTKLKSVLVDFLVAAGIRPRAIVSYNHLGNNDGFNLTGPSQFRSKEISKSNVVDDIVMSNPILYPPPLSTSRPDHTVVIKYVPFVRDSKRAMDEYTSEIFMGGHNTIVVHNTCEDSLLAAPLILDLLILTELCQRIGIVEERHSESEGCAVRSATKRQRTIAEGASEETAEKLQLDKVNGCSPREPDYEEYQQGLLSALEERRNVRKVIAQMLGEEQAEQNWKTDEHEQRLDALSASCESRKESLPKLHSVLSILSYLCKAPVVPPEAPLVNALFSQREAIVNFLRACVGLPPDDHLHLEHKVDRTALLGALTPLTPLWKLDGSNSVSTL